ncbi:hypothetical protein [Pontixanthobacter gangjinensis]|uniref:Tetratricopeptide repeat protein n=1 Tax=Pontixanthobacter gangjinensis TaxID=1028742 RepID=A0A6I4SMA8_9SPHN|nr:hypothetical protein [Pontixanthobacter gangjinensis]MXO56804.1 hypothetical protein [Pontixanthobacter gangjinensis]
MNTLKRLLLPSAIVLGLAAMTPTLAQDAATNVAETEAEAFADLEAMAEVAVDEEAGILFAQEQASRGEILQAIATLERVLALHPKSQSARLLHAVYLCQIDDQAGGAVELGKLKKKNFPEDLWAQAMSVCPLAAAED